ncbi:MAG: 50S ribosomal protein L29 [Micavibrio sp.]|nr:50S ribosomal protein L29 [Micavibrio sp.]|tara:strand:- start:4171 stop:4449 length:279 start_codon:yes stop_codon:yes gene_type:complete
MKAEDLKTKTQDELKKLLLDTRKDQMNLRFQKTNGTLDNTSEMRKKRRTVARIKTYLNAKPADKAASAAKAPAKKAAAKKTTKPAAKKAAAK